jgi:fructose-1-phosphate kinase PfkB-like protein
VEFSELAGTELKTDEEIVAYARTVIEKGVEMVVVSMGAAGALLVRDDVVLRGKVPSISDDTVGAGDSMVAGLVMGTVQGLSVEHVFHIGLACSVSAIMNKGPGLAEPETFARAFPMISVERVSFP